MNTLKKVISRIVIISFIFLSPTIVIAKGIKSNPNSEKNNRQIKDSAKMVESINSLPVPTRLEILDSIDPEIFEDGLAISLSFTQGKAVYVISDAPVGPVTFSFMGKTHTENSAPFHMNGDNNYVSFPTGVHEIAIQTPDYIYSVFIDVAVGLDVEEPVVAEPVVEEPVVEEPVVEEPVVEEPAVEEPAVEEPAVEEPVVAEPLVAETAEQEGAIYNVQPGSFNLYPRETTGWDESGWSIIAPSDDSRLIYVSSSEGDDSTATFYVRSDVASVDEPGSIKPFKTIEEANLNSREGYPDWVLLRRGDIWEVHENIQLKTGRSVSERSVITSYGPSNQRPMIKSDAIETFRIWSERTFIAITGIRFYAYKRDPESTEFSGWGQAAESTGIRVYSKKETVLGTILVEGNDFNYFSKGISINGGGDVLDVVIRRNTIRNSYSEDNHSQGIYAFRASVLLEENIFDHNGWYKPQVDAGNDKDQGQATMFNHNTYFSESFNSKFIRNIFLRSSSIQNKWTANSDSDSNIDSIKAHDLWMEDNLYVGGEVGISAGGNTDYDTGPRWENITIINNVMLAIGRDQPTNRTLGWNIDATDWDGGLICGNYLLHSDNPQVTNLSGIRLSGHSNDVTITKNTIHGLIAQNPGSKTGAISVDAEVKENITISENNIQLVDSNMRVLVADQLNSVVFEGNKYFSSLEQNELFSSVGFSYDIDTWRQISGDINSTVVRDQFLEPRRTFETYLSSIGLPKSIDNFIGLAANQSRGSWDRNFTAQAVLEYIREAYGNLNCQ